ncbi:MAG: hypothetical protein ABEJ24_04315 [Candidatus Magasanikbacteria bacterium]
MPEKVTEDTIIGDIIHEWEISEYEDHDRGPTWIIISSLLGLGLVIFAVWSQNFLFALIIMLLGIIIFLQHNQEPAQIPFAITELGIVVGNKFYPYGELDAFFIVYEPPKIKKLYFETESKIKPLVHIPLKEQNPVEVRETLKGYIPEDLDREEEPLSDFLAREWKLH